MANYKFVNADQLDADLQSVANVIKEKGKTTGKLSFPDGFTSAINSISTGVEVKRVSGTLNGLSSTAKYCECGFKPDLVYLYMEPLDANGIYHTAFAFAERTNISSVDIDAKAYISISQYGFLKLYGSTSENGFSVSADATSSNEIQYVAVKYT